MNAHYDTVIVGGGSAGSVLAARLTEDPGRHVLLLEAGRDFADPEELPAYVKWGYGGTITDPGVGVIPDYLRTPEWSVYAARGVRGAPDLVIPRGRLIGGTGAVNGTIFLRGMPEDYDLWASWGSEEWSWERILPSFRKVESDLDFGGEFHGREGPIPVFRFPRADWQPTQQAFHAACLEAGYEAAEDHNHPSSTGVGPLPFNVRDRIRRSTARAYLLPARLRPNLRIQAESTVLRVDVSGGRATAVEVQHGGDVERVSGDEIILAAGAIGTPHLLLLSGIGDAQQLGAHRIPVVRDLPGVGRNLRDHVKVWVTWELREDVPVDLEGPVLQLAARYTGVGAGLRNDMMLYMNSVVIENGRNAIRIDPVNNLALSAGELTLASADPLAPPLLDFRYLDHPSDAERLRESVHRCLELAGTAALRKIIAKQNRPAPEHLASDAAIDEWIRQNATTGHHISSTCKMGPASDPSAVVNQYGLVHGLESLRVCDASIMPDSVRANIHSTVIAMAERMSDLIAAGH